MNVRERYARWLDSLPPARLATLAGEFADTVAGDGLTVWKPAEERFLPIPPCLSPEPVERAEMDALAADARALLGAAVVMARWTLANPREAGAEILYSGFTPLEHEALARDPARLARVATARVDYFRRAAGAPAQALELNATIPAMQGYSDVILRRWIELMARERGVDPAPFLARAGSNTADLLASLVEHYHLLGGKQAHPSILIVSRRGDSQIGELRHYERAFSAAGHRALHVWVDEVDVDGAGRLGARGERFELLYRHIFARRVDPGSALGKLLVDPGDNVILNPVVSPLEVKGLLGLLHQAATEEKHVAAHVLDDDQRAAIVRRVPWTRVLRRESSTLPGGERVADLAAYTAAHPDTLVVKRSWDYGGKGVFIGPDAASENFHHKLAEVYGDGCRSWQQFVGHAAVDTNAWVVQELVPPVPVRHLIVEARQPVWREVFVDVNAYANLGVPTRPRGGVCRASGSKIVNILGGGGLAPFCDADILEELLPPEAQGATG